MASFEIYGGKPLKGELIPQGAKNEALQVLCAPLLTEEKVTISNIPDIVDVNKLIALLQIMGVKIEKIEKGTYSFQAKEIDLKYLESEDFKIRAASLRGSIMIVGPLLARFGRGFIPKPGGDKIGRRRLDTHFEGFALLGAKFNYDAGEHFYSVEAKKLIKRSLAPASTPRLAANEVSIAPLTDANIVPLVPALTPGTGIKFIWNPCAM